MKQANPLKNSASMIRYKSQKQFSLAEFNWPFQTALAETINGRYKAEVIHKRGPWKTVDEVEFATLEWVNWLNNRRPREPIGNIPPVGYEKFIMSKMKSQPWWLDSNI